MQPLSTRQQSILNRVVDIHIETAQPVGSRFLTGVYTQLYRDSYSPATVRHEMGTLEEMGYLTHPHTSAGRVPTDLGYRYYVDHSLKAERISQQLIQQVTQDLAQARDEMETFAEKASEILSNLSEELGIVLMAETRGEKNNRMKVFLQGSSRLLDKPEFQDMQSIRPLFQALEEKNRLADWLFNDTDHQGISIKIGRENGPGPFHICSVISTRYTLGGAKNGSGTLALIGPRRMNYSRVVALVGQVAKVVENLFSSQRNSLEG